MSFASHRGSSQVPPDSRLSQTSDAASRPRAQFPESCDFAVIRIIYDAMLRAMVPLTLCTLAVAQMPQNPSPMVEHTRAHPRLPEARPPGRREPLDPGTLFLPAGAGLRTRLPLLVFFHGGDWLPEVAGAHTRSAVISIQLGSGSAVYARAFADPARFPRLIQQAEQKAGARFSPITVGGWSAGCGAIREILKSPLAYARIDRVIAIDGIHTDYVDGKPGPLESQLDPANLDLWLPFARDAVAGKKRLLITHSEIFPGAYASTTETADYLLGQLHLVRRAVLRWGPMQTQELSEVRAGNFHLIGFAGNSAPDHVDELHSLPQFLLMMK